MKHPVEATLSAAGCFAIGVFDRAPMLVSELHGLAVLFETREGGKTAKQSLFYFINNWVVIQTI